MNSTLISFLLTTLAGLSTLIGSIVIFLNKKNKDKIIISSLAFASSVMILISLTDLIPESYNMLKNIFKLFPLILIILISINIGIILSFYIKKYIPENKNNNLYKVGLISMLAIIMHNIPEGMATFMASNTNISLGISLTIAIALHNIPEGISIAVPIYYSTNSKIKAILYTFISGLSELFGAIITYIFLKPFINDFIMGILFSIIAGIMIHIAISELLPTSLSYKNTRLTKLFLLLGLIFIIISRIFL
ncbi:MAG: zinc transporter ZupT [Lactobacillales bacterium]|nr:zinc transporter ZupT [Lactobacillales bacterium]